MPQAEAVNKVLVDALVGIAASPDWEPISTADEVYISRMTLSPEFIVGGQRIGDEANFAMIKSEAVLEAPPAQVFALFIDNRRAPEFNEYCKEVVDLEYLDAQTKVTWSCSGHIAGGLVHSRDFVTRSHYTALKDGTLVIANRAEDHPGAPPTQRHVRMKMVWGGNIIRPAPGGAGGTLLTTLTHINPGGAGETRCGRMFLQATAASGPRKFVQGLRGCIHMDGAQTRGHDPAVPKGGERPSGADTCQPDEVHSDRSSRSPRLSMLSAAETEDRVSPRDGISAEVSEEAGSVGLVSAAGTWGWIWGSGGPGAGKEISQETQCHVERGQECVQAVGQEEEEFVRNLRAQLDVWQRCGPV